MEEQFVVDALLRHWRNHPQERCFCVFCKNDWIREIAYEGWQNTTFNQETRDFWQVVFQYECWKVFDGQ